MNEYSEGDTIEAVKDKERLSGLLVREDGGPLKFHAGFHWHYPGDLVNHDFTITVIEKAKQELDLPSGADHYGTVLWVQTTAERAWIVLTVDGWQKLHWGQRIRDEEITETLAVIAEPRPVIAKSILDRIRKDRNGDGGYYDHQYTAKQLRNLFAEFGVTND